MVRPAPVEPTLAARSACQPWMPRKQETTSVRESLLILVLTEPPTTEEADATSVVVDNRNELRQFPASRRARITPEQAGLPGYGGHRRVAGLRREEVALLAGVSVDYYTRLERGNLGGVSEAVLDALAQALQLDEAERRPCSTWPGRPPPRPGRGAVRPPSGSGRASSASWPPTGSAPPSTPRSLSTRCGRPTWPALCSSVPGPMRSSPTGRAPPATWWPTCAPRPAATP